MLTSKEYIKIGGSKCPACHSKEIIGGTLDYEGYTIYQQVSCGDCNAAWYDVYKLIGYVELETETDIPIADNAIKITGVCSG